MHTPCCYSLEIIISLMCLHGFVPDGFGAGVIIVKDKSGDLNNIDNLYYRGITLTPIISKLFASIILRVFNAGA